jgi:hypothetical protein
VLKRVKIIEFSVVNVGKANAPTDGRLPSQHIISHTGLNNSQIFPLRIQAGIPFTYVMRGLAIKKTGS